MYFVGYTRFSLFQPESRAWAVTTKIPNYRSYLYSADRLEPRATIFFEHSLPQIDAAVGDHHVRHIVAYSAEMPTTYRRKMEEAGARYSWLVLDEHVDGKGNHNTDDTARQLMTNGPNHGVFGIYRVDDDDILPIDYFDRMSCYTTPANVGMYVSFGAGITAIQDKEGFRNPRHVVQRMLSAGMLSVCQLQESGGVVKPPAFVGHNRADEAAPVIVDSRAPGFYWNRSLEQDTTYAITDGTPEIARTRIEKTLSLLPPVTDFEEIYTRFPTLRGTFH